MRSADHTKSDHSARRLHNSGDNGDDARLPPNELSIQQTRSARSICSLSDGELSDRLAQWRALGERALDVDVRSSSSNADSGHTNTAHAVAHRADDGQVSGEGAVVLTFDSSEAELIAWLIAAEHACCPSIDLTLVRVDGVCELSIATGSDAGMGPAELVALLVELG